MQMKFKPAHEVANSRPKPRGPLGLGMPGLFKFGYGSAHWAIHKELSAESDALQLGLETVVTIADSGRAVRRRRRVAAPSRLGRGVALAAAQSGHSHWQAVPGRRGPISKVGCA